VFLAATGALGSMAVHMFVPSMPLVARDLGARHETIQLAITLYLVGMGLGQLVAGPFADRNGRRPVLICGLLLFTAGTVGCMLAGSGLQLIISRLVQATGAAAVLVAVRAIVADLTERREAAARVAMLMTAQLVSPALSPLLGGAIATVGGWRAIFGVLGVAGLLASLACFTWITETRRERHPDNQLRLMRSFTRLLGNTRFLRFAAGVACSSCALYVFLSASSFLLLDRYGLGTGQAGVCYAIVALASIGGTFLVRHLELRGGAFRLGLLASSAGGALLIGLASAGCDGPVSLIGPMSLVGLGGGIAAPAGIAGAMHAEEGLEGTAASMAGALQMFVSGATTSIIVHAHLASTLSIAVAIMAAGITGLLVAPRGRAT